MGWAGLEGGEGPQCADDGDADGGDKDRIGNRDDVRAVASKRVARGDRRRGRGDEVEPFFGAGQPLEDGGEGGRGTHAR